MMSCNTITHTRAAWIAMFRHEIDQESPKFGEMQIGDPSE